MSPAHVLEPTFQRLKRKLMEGAWPPGEKLEALRLADEFGVSMTPVRDCLNRLVGEQLVEMKPGEGYRVPHMSEQALRDALNLNAVLLDHAVQNEGAREQTARSKPMWTDHADRVAALFETIAARAGNSVLNQTVRSLSERMHFIRNLDLQVFPDGAREIEEMEELMANGQRHLRSKIADYHERRRNGAPTLIRLLH